MPRLLNTTASTAQVSCQNPPASLLQTTWMEVAFCLLILQVDSESVIQRTHTGKSCLFLQGQLKTLVGALTGAPPVTTSTSLLLQINSTWEKHKWSNCCCHLTSGSTWPSNAEQWLLELSGPKRWIVGVQVPAMRCGQDILEVLVSVVPSMETRDNVQN